MPKSKPTILLVMGAKPKWTYKYMENALSSEFNVITFSENIPVYIKKIEQFLMFFVKGPKTIVQRNISHRSMYLSKNKYANRLVNFLPKFLSPDAVCRILGMLPSKYKNSLHERDISKILYVSIFPDYFYPVCAAKNTGKEVICWIYSWDNPFKDNFVPTCFDKYFVWNDFMKRDLFEVHNIPLEKQYIVGPIQFDYLKNEKLDEVLLKDLPQNYYMFTFGTNNQTVEHEMDVLEVIADSLVKTIPSAFVVARTYPSGKARVDYDRLKKHKNVFLFETDVREAGLSYEQVNRNKYTLIAGSLGVFNVGTTMGIEAAILNKPVVQIAFLPKFSKSFEGDKYYFNLDKILENDHLRKYVIKHEYCAVVKSEEELENTLKKIKDGSSDAPAYSKYLRELVDPNPDKLSMEGFKKCLL